MRIKSRKGERGRIASYICINENERSNGRGVVTKRQAMLGQRFPRLRRRRVFPTRILSGLQRGVRPESAYFNLFPGFVMTA